MTLARIHAWVAGLAGRRRALAAFAAGVVSVLALPPIFVLPALPLAAVGLLWLLDGIAAGPTSARMRTAFALGWWFGLGHFVVGLYWIANAMLVDAARFGWLAPFAVLGLSAYFAIYPALALALAARARPGLARIFAFAAAWTLAEMLRGVVLTGFPWNPAGSVLAAHPALMQGAALGGVYALSFVAVLLSALAATLAGANGAAAGIRWRPSAVALAGLTLIFAAGAVRLADAPAMPAAGPIVRVVQGAIAQDLKWRPEQAREHFGVYLALSRQAPPAAAASMPAPVAVIWPETAVPAIYDGGPDIPRAVAQAAPPGGIVITGVVRRTSRAADAAERAVWNSIIAVDGAGRVLGRYDKHHLVPFGEYVPFRRFNPLPKLTEGRIDFSPGPGRATLALPDLPALAPLVCYEAIFPGAVVARSVPRAGLLLNLTNDAWFGRATGPYQHLVAARLRAIEEGLPMIRAANTGISAAIDAHGRVLTSLGLGRRGAFDVALPQALAAPPPFARWGNRPILILSVVVLLAALAWSRRP